MLRSRPAGVMALGCRALNPAHFKGSGFQGFIASLATHRFGVSKEFLLVELCYMVFLGLLVIA